MTSDPTLPSGSRPNTPLRFLFVTLGFTESEFYGRVGLELTRRGHAVGHLTASRRAVSGLQRRGARAWCLADEMSRSHAPSDPEADAEAACRRYGTATFREIYRTDIAAEGRSDEWAVPRTLRMLAAVERVFEEFAPTTVIPEVGTETIRTAAHLVGLRRRTPVLFLFYTIFDKPLRLYVDDMHQHIVAGDELVEPCDGDRARVRRFIEEFTQRRESIRKPRDTRVSARLARSFARHLLVKAIWDRDNEWLRPWPWLRRLTAERLRARAARAVYAREPKGRFVYFPLHVVEDYKIKKVLPHCYDQGALIELVANALPHGVHLVAKEHPLAVGRTPLGLLRRLSRLHNVRVVAPECNSHDLIRGADAVVTIGSTVGLEALLYGKPVLTIGDPFYAGAGVTVDAGSTAEVPSRVAEVLNFVPEPSRVEAFLAAAMARCRAGRPVLIDKSDANAIDLAASLEAAGIESHRS